MSSTLNDLQKHLKAHIRPYFGVRVALSGGLDSMLLLYVCQTMKQAGLLSYFDAIYINHLEPYSEQAQAFCQAYCQKEHIDLICHSISAPATRNRESTWREARYAAFKTQTPLMVQILLAHHVEDQAETFLLNALRGSGTMGLSGMPLQQWNERYFIRPFLHISQQTLYRFAQDIKLPYLTDPSNHDLSLRRNYLRHTVMPLLAKQWHHPQKQLAVSAQLCQSVHTTTALAQATEHFRLWLKAFNIQLGREQIKSIFRQLTQARSDKQVCIQLPGWTLIRAKRMLYLEPNLASSFAPIQLKHGTQRYNYWIQVKLKQQAYGYGIAEKFAQDLTLHQRQGGEVIQLSHSQPRQKVKKLLQAWSIPERVKLDCPLIYYRDQVVAIPGFALDDRFCDKSNTTNIQLILQENLANCGLKPQICLDDFFVQAPHL